MLALTKIPDLPAPRRGRRSIITKSIAAQVQRRKLGGQTILQISTDIKISRSTIYKILSILGYKTKIVFENSDDLPAQEEKL